MLSAGGWRVVEIRFDRDAGLEMRCGDAARVREPQAERIGFLTAAYTEDRQK